jgi:hypothetical protein
VAAAAGALAGCVAAAAGAAGFAVAAAGAAVGWLLPGAGELGVQALSASAIPPTLESWRNARRFILDPVPSDVDVPCPSLGILNTTRHLHVIANVA